MKLTSLVKSCMSIVLCLFAGAVAHAQINLAGVYELNRKIEGSVYQMYLELDFANQRPDFTQTFTTKTAVFKFLPEDFMNAKKLKKCFQGTKASGFGKYRERTLFSLTEEFRITNPYLKGGVIIADWENEVTKTGKVVIIPNEDGSIVTYGLTALDRSLSPDGMRLELVKDLLPAGAPGHRRQRVKETSIDEIKEQCEKDLPGIICLLQDMPDDETETDVQPADAPKPAGPLPKNGNDDIKIDLWKDTQAISFHFHTISIGGDFGKFETHALLDFWPEDNGEISMRMYGTTVYVNSGNRREYEKIYTGHRKGNKIIFTRCMDSLNGRDYEPLESWEPSEVVIKSPTQIVFDRCTYTKKIN